MKRRIYLFTAIGLYLLTILLPSTAAAQWGGEIRGQMGFGGDELYNVGYSDGSESSLRLGTYFTFSAGPVYEVWSQGKSAVELQAMLGWAGWSTGPENTEDRIKLNRFPLELMAFYGYRIPERDMMLRFGGGFTWHLGGGVSGTGSLDYVDLDLDNAMGTTTEITVISGIISGGIRYTHMKPSVEGLPEPANGSSVGLFLGLTMPRNL